MSIRRSIAIALFAVAPVVLAAPAGALSVGDTVCYAADGSSVINPPNPEDYESCTTRESGGTTGGNTPQVCTIQIYTSISGDGTTAEPKKIVRCSSLQPLTG